MLALTDTPLHLQPAGSPHKFCPTPTLQKGCGKCVAGAFLVQRTKNTSVFPNKLTKLVGMPLVVKPTNQKEKGIQVLYVS